MKYAVRSVKEMTLDELNEARKSLLVKRMHTTDKLEWLSFANMSDIVDKEISKRFLSDGIIQYSRT